MLCYTCLSVHDAQQVFVSHCTLDHSSTVSCFLIPIRGLESLRKLKRWLPKVLGQSFPARP